MAVTLLVPLAVDVTPLARQLGPKINGIFLIPRDLPLTNRPTCPDLHIVSEGCWSQINLWGNVPSNLSRRRVVILHFSDRFSTERIHRWIFFNVVLNYTKVGLSLQFSDKFSTKSFLNVVRNLNQSWIVILHFSDRFSTECGALSKPKQDCSITLFR